MCILQVETLLERLRKIGNGVLPMYINRQEQYEIFAGESGVMLPENWVVASQITFSDAYPSLPWLAEQYAKFLEFLRFNSPELLVDSSPSKVVPTLEGVTNDSNVSKYPAGYTVEMFNRVIEGSVSNVEPKVIVENAPIKS